MEKRVVINRLAQICYRPKTEDDDDYAVQLFVEALVLPENLVQYTEEEIRECIESFINNSKMKFEEEEYELDG